MPASKSRSDQAANYKYETAKAYDKVLLRLPKGKRAEIKAHADEHGESVNGFITRAIENQIAKDTTV